MGGLQRAVLDVVGPEPGGPRTLFLDVTVAAEESTDPERLRAHARRRGAAARAAELAKRARYSKVGPAL
eukprot:3387826-Alexandrium_andersonii.AAC.1